jgi:hypothetical protein
MSTNAGHRVPPPPRRSGTGTDRHHVRRDHGESAADAARDDREPGSATPARERSAHGAGAAPEAAQVAGQCADSGSSPTGAPPGHGPTGPSPTRYHVPGGSRMSAVRSGTPAIARSAAASGDRPTSPFAGHVAVLRGDRHDGHRTEPDGERPATEIDHGIGDDQGTHRGTRHHGSIAPGCHRRSPRATRLAGDLIHRPNDPTRDPPEPVCRRRLSAAARRDQPARPRRTH